MFYKNGIKRLNKWLEGVYNCRIGVVSKLLVLQYGPTTVV